MKQDCIYHCYRTTPIQKPKKNKKIKPIQLVCFDMDGVLTDTLSSWKHIHDHFKTSNEHSVEAYLKGNIDDLEFIKRDVLLWNHNGQLATLKEIEQILHHVPLMNGAKECITFLQTNNIKTAIVSAGIDILAEKVAHQLQIDVVYANGFKTDKDGRLTGEGILKVPLAQKDIAVKNLADTLNISLDHCAAVGNSCFDIPMFETVGLGIAFNPEDTCVQTSADIIVKEKNLKTLIPIFSQYLKK